MSVPPTMTVYFDNAATSYPKPEEVYRAQDAYFRQSANPGRGAYELALASARALFDARLSIAAFFGIAHAERLAFTGGCTQALNMALKGFGLKAGDVVLTSSLEHNSVMRPLKQLEARGIKVVVLPYAPEGVISPDDLRQAVRGHAPRLCVVCEVSNVTGEIVDLNQVTEILRPSGVPLLVDAAQSAGWCEHDLSGLGVSMWCAAGHKGLMGPPGVGLLYVAPGVEIEPLIAGGTGSFSEDFDMPDNYPDHLEAGTGPGPAVAGLASGVGWLAHKGVAAVRKHEQSLTAQFLGFAKARRQFKIYGPLSASRRAPLVSFQVEGISPDRVADLLDREHGIAVRSGLHCAAQAHRALGTSASGVVRASFGYFNTEEEVEKLCRALQAIGG